MLTYYFQDEKLFLAYLLSRCIKDAVQATFDCLGTETFHIF